MLIVGLTGSIGMGKSTVATRFRELGVPVFDADAEVRRLYEGPAVARIGQAFPGAVIDGRVDRARLSAALADDPASLECLERIVHPLVRAAEEAFLVQCLARGAERAVLEVPLLLETGLDELVDVVIVVSAPADVQRKRVLGRPGMTSDKLDQLLSRQMSDAEKRVRADFVVDSAVPLEAMLAEVGRIVTKLKACEARAIARWKLATA
jgi:dephospho-CoA kinase